MSEEMRVETMELCVTACEKFATNNEVSVNPVLSSYAWFLLLLLVLPVNFFKITVLDNYWNEIQTTNNNNINVNKFQWGDVISLLYHHDNVGAIQPITRGQWDPAASALGHPDVSASDVAVFPVFSQSAAKMIKESMDKKFGSSWHVVIGEGFGFEVTHEVKNLLYMFFGGSLAVCVWKCS